MGGCAFSFQAFVYFLVCGSEYEVAEERSYLFRKDEKHPQTPCVDLRMDPNRFRLFPRASSLSASEITVRFPTAPTTLPPSPSPLSRIFRHNLQIGIFRTTRCKDIGKLSPIRRSLVVAMISFFGENREGECDGGSVMTKRLAVRWLCVKHGNMGTSVCLCSRGIGIEGGCVYVCLGAG